MQRSQMAFNGLHPAQRQALMAYAARGHQIRILRAQNMSTGETAAVENLQ